MEWAAPEYIWMLGGLPMVVGLFIWAQRKRREAYAHGWISEDMRPTLRWRRQVQAAIVTMAVALLVLGLARPRMGGAEREVEQRGLDLVIALDLSRSMQAEDIAPTRFDRARSELLSVFDQLAGDRVALVVFAGTGLLQAPLTTDYAALRSLLDAADPRSMPTPGSNLEGALQAATTALDARDISTDPNAPPRAQAVLLLSDGEFHDGEVEAARAQAQSNDIALYTAGLGTKEGARVPIYNENGTRTDWLREDNGSIVTSRLNASALRALPTGPGRYYELGPATGSLSVFVDDLRGLERSLIGVERFEAYYEGFWILLALALGLLLVDAVWDPARPAFATNPATT
jgi:Ca-activated chloride channel family protein